MKGNRGRDMAGRARKPGAKKARPRGVQSRHPEVYVEGAKPAGALLCRDCGVVQHAGRWTWNAPPQARVQKGLCPACRRIRDEYPAGTIQLDRAFLRHKKEILGLIRRVERAEKAEHPLERVMGTVESGGRLVVTTTGIHIARQIAHKLARRFHKRARIRYAEDESLVHVDWD